MNGPPHGSQTSRHAFGEIMAALADYGGAYVHVELNTVYPFLKSGEFRRSSLLHGEFGGILDPPPFPDPENNPSSTWLQV